ncbi:hypothetical protein N657DRAFT_647620 [Parathielavia appendiculata]|uniref:Uncharacterized protein n=1 Tax=Parathielavia appendiculata TaxID=2587402 RepID=A0AAN6TVL2_9PEZI|nr:hypothetical protein N657DRAFT_647620 [Parathielavia appendiculata]
MLLRNFDSASAREKRRMSLVLNCSTPLTTSCPSSPTHSGLMTAAWKTEGEVNRTEDPAHLTVPLTGPINPAVAEIMGSTWP